MSHRTTPTARPQRPRPYTAQDRLYVQQQNEQERRRRLSVLPVERPVQPPSHSPRNTHFHTECFLNLSTTLVTAGAEEETCVICLSDVRFDTCLRRINSCGHKFHKTCVDNWFKKNLKCPICRYNLVEGETERLQGVICNMLRECNTILSRLRGSNASEEVVRS